MRVLVLVAAAAICLSAPAAAAPQVLGLQASNGPVPLLCDDEDCSAVAGTFCLQRERAMPTYGTPYTPTYPERLTLSLLTAGGSVIDIGAEPYLRFAAYSGYNTVRMIVPRSLPEVYDAVAVAVHIGPGVSLVPVATAKDRNPQLPDEIALATGPLRQAAGRYLDAASVNADAARLVAALMNALAESRTIHDDNSRLWDSTVTAATTAGYATDAVPQARRAYEQCRGIADLRGCLLNRHREMMQPDNRRFWDESVGY